MKQLKLISILFLVTFIGCNDEDNSQLETTVDYTEIAKSALYGNGEEGISQSNMVIQNETDWENLKNQMDSYNDVTDNFHETNIDFENYTLIAVFLEIKMSGYEVNIKKVTETENVISVSTTENAFMSSVICQPFCIIKIPKTEKTIIFE
ncbi:protease complex subunit PrcB family protein [Marinifilum sp. D737]|uniref:protease complex subunit PrcB family protein n=1 Tax=Marinifilum sp. D737 TaxID=2969628 RepID=UPI002276954C|nr:protease complex subunit PrcB family protein [Marinifilum sp. D737]MCY1633073.1 protease complex subunit PrcB family protein [Marinifilum sp. D737]